jgi:Uma2 family endonuclease
MALMVLDQDLEDRLIAERQASGGDRYDEVWEGVYMMAPLANNEHADLQGGLTAALHESVTSAGLGRVQPGANVSDRERGGWVKNYRCPDVVVVLKEGRAEDHGTHWFGGPDFAIEIVSKTDRSREKFEFYASVGVRELLIVDRFPWILELYRLVDGVLELVASCKPDDGVVLVSEVVPNSFRPLTGEGRPHIEVTHRDGARRWLV